MLYNGFAVLLWLLSNDVSLLEGHMLIGSQQLTLIRCKQRAPQSLCCGSSPDASSELSQGHQLIPKQKHQVPRKMKRTYAHSTTSTVINTSYFIK
jgi:hypothetical protein